MYGDGKRAFGRLREAGDDWYMFGVYIFHNVGIGFRCFGAGILAGVGSALVLLYNGLMIGAVAGHLEAGRARPQLLAFRGHAFGLRS